MKDLELAKAELEECIVLALDIFDEEGEEGLEAFYLEHPEQAAGVRSALASLEVHGLSSPKSGQLETPNNFPSVLGGYEIIRPLGGGGMGVVYLARDQELGRDVALKLVRPDLLHFAGARERFRREIQTVAKLQHAGIVPLYGVGEDGGVPFYSMEHVPGCTLGEVIEALVGRSPEELKGSDLQAVLAEHGEGDKEQTTKLFQGSWEEVCLRIVREVAEALEYAHRRGVVHRDVKPSNIMVTPSGRVQLFDFGLSSSRGGARITRSGVHLGSLAYMAPEMLTGKAQEDDARLDVYSLGVTLYELLTLSLPHTTESEGALRESVLSGHFPAPRKRNQKLSWEAETICLAASDADPRSRYASAAEFARDVTNALESRPLAAKPPGVWIRTRRWVQRHPVWAAVLVSLFVGPSLLALQEFRNGRALLAKSREIESQSREIEAANLELASALTKEEASREAAEQNFEKALEAVDRMLARVGDETLADTPHMSKVRTELLGDALEFYEWFLARKESRDLLAASARIGQRAANLQNSFGNLEEARRLIETAETRMEAIEDKDLRLRTDAVYTRVTSARFARLRTDYAVAEEKLAKCREALEAEDQVEDPGFLQALGFERLESGHVARDLGKLEESADAFEEAALAYEVLVELDPREPITLRFLAEAYLELGGVLSILGRDLEEVIAALDGSMLAAQQRLDLDLEDVEAKYAVARAAYSKSGNYINAGKFDEALEFGNVSYDMLDLLVRDFPRAIRFRDILAMNAAALSGVYGQRGELERAEAFGGEAIEHLEALGAPDSREPRLLGSLGVAMYNLALVHSKRGDREAFVEAIDAAVSYMEASAAVSRGNPYHEHTLRETFGRGVGMFLDNQMHEDAFERVVLFCDRAKGAADFLEALERADDCLWAVNLYEEDERRAELAALYTEVAGEMLKQHGPKFGLGADAVRRNPELSNLLEEAIFVEAVDRLK